MAKLPRATVALALGALAWCAVACSALLPTSSLRGTEPDASDATIADGPSPDAPGAEGGLDASDGGRWCPSQTGTSAFCDDFDDEGPLDRWTGNYLNAGGTVTRSGTTFRSAPYSLLAVTPGGNGSQSAAVYRSTVATLRKVHVGFDMKVDTRDQVTGYTEVNYIRFERTNATSAAFYMRLHKSVANQTVWTAEAYLADGGIPQHNVAVTGNPRFDQWTRVDLDVDLETAPQMMTITIDGVAAGKDTLEPSLYTPGPMRVELGLGYTGSPSGEWRIRYDNATIDWR